MQRCDQSQAELSALLDREVDAEALANALDHALNCARCARSYAGFRSLQLRMPATPAARRSRRRAWIAPLRGLALAASVVLALSWAWSSAPDAATPRPARDVMVQIGAHPERMDDARFVALAVELLQADPRYARSMQELLHHVGDLNSEAGAVDGGSIRLADTASPTRRYH